MPKTKQRAYTSRHEQLPGNHEEEREESKCHRHRRKNAPILFDPLMNPTSPVMIDSEELV